jgi:AcrR family transcriptional regulator
MNERVDRILDTAGELMLRMGYRKVTVDDIAAGAGVGKGTIYLHWRTKDELFEALLLRESIALLKELIAALRRDPAEVLPHRLTRTIFLAAHRRPLVKALFVGDMELLGKLTTHPLRSQDLLAADRFKDVMDRFGLIRPDVPGGAHTLKAAITGFYLHEAIDAGWAVEKVADALTFTVRHTFEPAEEPAREVLAAAAAETISIYRELIGPYEKWIYE